MIHSLHCCKLLVLLQITHRLPSCTVFFHFSELELLILGLMICLFFLLFIYLLLKCML